MPAGRPETPKTPEALHERALLDWGKLNDRVRKLLEQELSFFERVAADAAKALSPDVDKANFDSHLTIADTLLKIATTVSTIMERGLRLQQQRPTDATEGDTDAIERELLGT